MKFFRKTDGLISVFLTLILVPTLVFGCTVSDFVKIISSRTVISGAGDLALNAALTNYDAALKDAYGLFAMSKTPEELEENLEKYFETCLNAAVGDGIDGYENVLQLDSKSFHLHSVAETEVCRPNVMNQQILEYAKYRAPVALGEDILERLNKIKDSSKVQKAIEKQLEVGEAFEDVEEACKKAYEKLQEHDSAYRDNPNIEEAVNGVKDRYKEVSKILVATCYIDQADNTQQKRSCTMEEFNSVAKSLEPNAVGIDSLRNFDTIMECLSMKVETSTDIPVGETQETELTEEEIQEQERIEQERQQRSQQEQQEFNENNNTLRICINHVVEAADQYIDESYTILQTADSRLSEIGETAEEAKKCLEDIEKLINDPNGVNKKLQDWKQAIDAIEDEEQKKQQNTQYEQFRKLINIDAIRVLKATVDNNINYCQNMRGYLSSIQFCTVQILAPSDPYLAYKSNAEYYSANYSIDSWSTAANQFFQNGFTLGTKPTGELKSIKEDEFYKELCKAYSSGSENKKAENKIKEKLNKGDEGQKKAKEEDRSLQNADWTSVTIPSEWLQNASAEKNSENLANISSDSSNKKKVSSSSKKAIQSAGDLLKDISSVGTAAVERLYLCEYMMDMFSYYTVDKDKKGNTIVPETMSGIKLSNDNTAMYRSEVEYMLWGDREAAKNVVYTTATIFGIRFLANCIFVFTNTTLIRQATEIATTLAGWTGFGVPLVQNVLLLSVALAESASDIGDLLSGKEVSFYKNNTEWNIWLGSKPISLSKGENNNFKLTYKDYLQVFVLANLISNTKKDRMLTRIADCIQLNLKKRGGETDMTKAMTMLTATAEVTTSTTFLYMIPKLTGTPTSDVPTKYTIKYKGVMAY